MIDDPVNYWPLEEGAGTSTADIVGGANGTLDTGASWIAGKIDTKALRFDKTADGHVSFPQVELGTVYTISFWVWVRDASGAADGVVIGGPATYYALYFDDTSLYHSSGPSNLVNVVHAGLPALRAWNHFALTRNDGIVQFYWNGAPLGAAQVLSTPTSHLALDTMGSYNGLNFPSQVDLDDVRFYNRVLSGAEVSDLFAFTGGTPPESHSGTSLVGARARVLTAATKIAAGSSAIVDFESMTVSAFKRGKAASSVQDAPATLQTAVSKRKSAVSAVVARPSMVSAAQKAALGHSGASARAAFGFSALKRGFITSIVREKAVLTTATDVAAYLTPEHEPGTGRIAAIHGRISRTYVGRLHGSRA